MDVVSFTPRPLYHRRKPPGTHWIGAWVGPRVGLDAVAKRKIPSPLRESNPNLPYRPVRGKFKVLLHCAPVSRSEDNIRLHCTEMGAEMLTGFIWLMIQTSGGFLWTRQWTFGLHKSRDFLHQMNNCQFFRSWCLELCENGRSGAAVLDETVMTDKSRALVIWWLAR
jgi:hypothetical protein